VWIPWLIGRSDRHLRVRVETGPSLEFYLTTAMIRGRFAPTTNKCTRQPTNVRFSSITCRACSDMLQVAGRSPTSISSKRDQRHAEPPIRDQLSMVQCSWCLAGMSASHANMEGKLFREGVQALLLCMCGADWRSLILVTMNAVAKRSEAE
jgi:hypothetical protein